MFRVIFWTIIFSLATAFSVMLTGDRSLISNNLFKLTNILKLILNWKFILAMILAIAARFAFIFINNSILNISYLAKNSTTITAFVTTVAYMFVVFANFLFLDERITLQQGIGCVIITLGIVILLK